ncbi:MAG: AraC family transcriptional regulator [Halioglobus sp.]
MPLPAQPAYPARTATRPLLNSYEIRLMARDLVDKQGVKLEQLIAGTGVSSRLLDNPAQRLTLPQELQLYTRIAQHNSDPLLGLRTGARLSLPNYGMLGHAMMGAATVNEVLQLLSEFAPLVSWASHSKVTTESVAGLPCKCLTVFPTAVDADAAVLEIESTFASLQTLFNDLVDEPIRFAAIQMSHHNRAPDAEAYQALFDCPVEFGQARNALLLPRRLLSRRLPHPQPEYSDLFRDLCRQSMSALVQDRGLVGTIRSLIQMGEGTVPTLEQVAAHFDQSSRTLRRHLQALGVSYQGLLDEVRFEEARRYLTSTQLGVDSIARLLGYAEARSFRTAFKRWAGVPPAAYRVRSRA